MTVVLRWNDLDLALAARESSPREIARHAEALAAFYNAPHNRAMLSATSDMTPHGVESWAAELRAAGGLHFLLELDGALVGDADLRHIGGGKAEFAIVIGERQGHGLGTRFAAMLHRHAFERLGMSELFVSIVPENRISVRLFEKLGYGLDTSADARRFAEGPSDLVLSLRPSEFGPLWSERLMAMTTTEHPPLARAVGAGEIWG